MHDRAVEDTKHRGLSNEHGYTVSAFERELIENEDRRRQRFILAGEALSQVLSSNADRLTTGLPLDEVVEAARQLGSQPVSHDDLLHHISASRRKSIITIDARGIIRLP